jgi:hypothetical protein
VFSRMILLEKSFSQGSIIAWGRIWLNTPHFCQSIRVQETIMGVLTL